VRGFLSECDAKSDSVPRPSPEIRYPRISTSPRKRAGRGEAEPHSSGSILTIEAPWLLPAQKVTGVVELSTNTRLMLVERGSR
jgi:hypothetical protein